VAVRGTIWFFDQVTHAKVKQSQFAPKFENHTNESVWETWVQY